MTTDPHDLTLERDRSQQIAPGDISDLSQHGHAADASDSSDEDIGSKNRKSSARTTLFLVLAFCSAFWLAVGTLLYFAI